ncbi:MAG TPA: ribosome maturation factor RimP [bacterium]|nr:ribosome maturation factor RimP [bacterium]
MDFLRTNTLSKKIAALAEPVCAACGVDLYMVEVLGDRAHGKTRVRVVIDALDGVGIDDCAKVSRQLSAVMDVEDPIKGAYNLEVSSPGLDRPLRNLDDVRAAIGKTIFLETRETIEGRKRFSGRVEDVLTDVIAIQVDGRLFHIPASAVSKAKLQYNFSD